MKLKFHRLKFHCVILQMLDLEFVKLAFEELEFHKLEFHSVWTLKIHGMLSAWNPNVTVLKYYLEFLKLAF